MTEFPLAAVEAEQSILSLLLAYQATFDLTDGLRAEHFYRAEHRAIYEVASELLASGQPADVITVFDRLSARYPDLADLPYLTELAHSAWSPSSMRRYVEIVIEKWQRRELVAGLNEVCAAAAEDLKAPVSDLIDRAQGGLQRLLEGRKDDAPVRVGDDLSRYVQDLEQRIQGGGVQGIPTGFPDLDDVMSGGIRPGNLIVVAARPKMGKSAFAFNIARNVSAQHSALILSMEMSRDEIHQRNIAAMGRIDQARLGNAKQFNPNDWPRVTHAIQLLQDRKLFIHQQAGMRLSDVRARARQIQRTNGLDVLVIDYLQLMEGEGDTRNAQIEQITRGLKAMAVDMGIGILLLSQLNRNVEQRPNKRPMPSDLRDSGAIEQDCDMAIFLYRDEVYNENSPDAGICEVNVALNRQGAAGRIGLAFIGRESRFESLAAGTEFGRAPQKPQYSMLKD
ncbi:replicative DNA helicase [Bordetella bronchialis]|uniref:replicative DNA helicase n=1 Tax=Bordetella bronchialis TaxID=463025 RepID=UPI003D08CC04